MAKEIKAIYLGQSSPAKEFQSADPDKERATALIGETFGGKDDPLHAHFQSLPAPILKTANQQNLCLRFHVIITYDDGFTARVPALIFQSEDGKTYLIPEASLNSTQMALEAAPIRKCQITKIDCFQIPDLELERYDWEPVQITPPPSICFSKAAQNIAPVASKR